MPRHLEAVEAELLAREPIFHQPELGTTREHYAAQTADDFWEVGASGRVYERAYIIDRVVERGKVPGDEHWTVSDTRCRDLGRGVFALTYRLDQDGRLTRRVTLAAHERTMAIRFVYANPSAIVRVAADGQLMQM